MSAAAKLLLIGRRNKYGAKRQVVDGHNFPSKAEAARYIELKLLQRAGKIVELELQPRFPLLVEQRQGLAIGEPLVTDLGTYIADFRYHERRVGDVAGRIAGPCVVEDVKGFDTPASRLRRLLAEALHGMKVRVIRKGARR